MSVEGLLGKGVKERKPGRGAITQLREVGPMGICNCQESDEKGDTKDDVGLQKGKDAPYSQHPLEHMGQQAPGAGPSSISMALLL